MSRKIKKFWNDFYKNIDYEESLFRDSDQVSVWKNAGHHVESTTILINQNFTIKDFPEVQQEFKELNSIQIAFHCLLPGHYLPTHIDRYNFYIKKHNILDHNTIKRYVVFLEDWADGHLLSVNTNIYSQWTAGDIVGWNGHTPHSAINLGIVNRYTLQVTGISN